MTQKFLISALLFVCNIPLRWLLYLVAGIFFDYRDDEFNRNVLEWDRTGQYPFSRIELILVPRIAFWPLRAEIAYQVLQTIVWAGNALVLRKYLKATSLYWITFPLAMHSLVTWDPVQMICGTTAFILVYKSWGKSPAPQR